ncbi:MULTISPECIES: HEPN domain-containing protein [Mesorhizobium]|uniref:HEPN domain-containing protein n=1 Tax=Mesorhizobium huakuii TaxID=28104 RepID=A0ABZ0VXU5_9HYPH|nr:MULTISPECIES: HEPN domain-containing protein [Mesorhizobium]PBB22815.1 hypothetical protein CK232_31225 [Mesorhizobium sp. WSM4304]PBB71709.1 hypothetical protein CK227_30585 [Mesorhizobium sp. WSM4308]WQC02348.1 HEPN domain-containing protein [Mesorhizobium huakuii]
MPDFKVADSEFDRQASILEILVKTIDVSSLQDALAPTLVAGAALPLVPAGGKNTMAAAAIVLLAAHFEEYVRQQVEEYAKSVIVEYAFLKSEFKDKLIDTYWRSGSGKLSRIKPKGFPGWAGLAEPVLHALIDYPIGTNMLSFQAKLVSEHENNMRFDTMAELCGRVGITKLGELMHKSKPLRDALNTPSKDQFNITLQRRVSEFYELRNGIVHSISQNAGVGSTVFNQWAVFFRHLTTAFSGALDDAFQKFNKEIEKAKHDAAASAGAG